MQQTIAVIACADTKHAEMDFIKQVFEREGFRALTIDVSSRGGYSYEADIGADAIASAGGSSLQEVFSANDKAGTVAIMQAGATAVVKDLFDQGRIHGILGLGGLQNSTIASHAMRQLPIGFPKLILSTVACGSRPFDLLVGDKDITVMPSIVDIAGVNPLTRIVLGNAAAAIMGMVRNGGEQLDGSRFLLGATMMGVTNDGVVNAVRLVKQAGYDVVVFHTTGVGGRTMEQLITSGGIGAVMDLCLHEIVSQDVIGGGFSYGAPQRLTAAARMGIPMVVSPGGLDFVDYPLKDFQSNAIGDWTRRKYTLHNKEIAHIKLFSHEAEKAAEIAVERLNRHTGKVIAILPLAGLRSETRPGERLHDPQVDEAIFSVFRKGLKKEIPLVEIDAHFLDEDFSRAAADAMLSLLP